MESEGLEKVIRRLQEAMKPFATEQAEANRNQQDDFRRSLADQFKRQRITDLHLAKQMAQFHYDNAQDILHLVEYCPDYPTQLLRRHLLKKPTTLKLVRASKINVEDLLRWRQGGPCHGMQPVILGAPASVGDNETFWVIGENFGPQPGTVSLVLDAPPGAIVPLTILNWSHNAVMLQVGTGLPAGIPFHAQGKLTLQRGDLGLGGVPCASSIAIEFEPSVKLLYVVNGVSDNGFDLNPFQDHIQSKYPVLKSTPYPPQAEPFFIGVVGSDVIIKIRSQHPLPNVIVPASASLWSGPSFTAARERQVTVEVKYDHWYWDYFVSAEFYVRLPETVPNPPGWVQFS